MWCSSARCHPAPRRRRPTVRCSTTRTTRRRGRRPSTRTPREVAGAGLRVPATSDDRHHGDDEDEPRQRRSGLWWAGSSTGVRRRRGSRVRSRARPGRRRPRPTHVVRSGRSAPPPSGNAEQRQRQRHPQGHLEQDHGGDVGDVGERQRGRPGAGGVLRRPAKAVRHADVCPPVCREKLPAGAYPAYTIPRRHRSDRSPGRAPGRDAGRQPTASAGPGKVQRGPAGNGAPRAAVTGTNAGFSKTCTPIWPGTTRRSPCWSRSSRRPEAVGR